MLINICEQNAANHCLKIESSRKSKDECVDKSEMKNTIK